MADEFEVDAAAAVDSVTTKSTGPGFGAIAGVVAGEASFSTLSDTVPNSVGAFALRDALKQAAVLICCDVLAQDIAKAPLQLVDRDTDQVVKPTEHPVARLFALDPNKRHTWFEFHEMAIYWYALTTNCFIYPQRMRTGEVTGLIPFQTGRVRPRTTGDQLFYHVSATTLQERQLLGVTSLDVVEEDMIHVRGRMLDGLNGYATLYAGSNTLDVGASIEQYIEDLFSEGGSIRGVFARDAEGAVSQEAYDRLKEQLRDRLRRFRRGEPLILEDKLKFNAIAANPDETDYIKQFEAQIIQTCRLFRMPPHKAMHLGAVKYENLGALEESYLNDTLLPITGRFEQKFERHILLPEDRLRFKIRFDRDALKVADIKTRAEVAIKLVERRVITINQALRMVNLPPVKGGDVYYMPSNAQIVSAANEILLSAGASQITGPSNDAEDADAKPAKGLRLVANT